jgi:putative polyhydroxyalkanoate system protein
MSEIHLRRTHGTTLKRARQKAEHIAEELSEEFGIAYAWDGAHLRFERPGLSGDIAVDKKEVEIRVKLGFLLLALRGRIEREIHAFCDENFGSAG